MTGHTISVAKSLEKKGLIEISLAISGLGFKKSKRWSNELGIKNFNLQGRGCLGAVSYTHLTLPTNREV